MTASTETDPADVPWADVAAFVEVIRAALGDLADEQHGPVGGYQWRWARRGLWTLTAGSVLNPDPVLAGPAGEWRIRGCGRDGAVYALLVLAGADALPAGVTVPGRSGLYVGRSAAPQPQEEDAQPPEEEVQEETPPSGAVPVAGVDGPRPRYRQPGGNTGARPGPVFRPGRPRPQVVAGPGAAYVPRQVGDDPPAGGDLLPRGDGLPDHPGDDTSG